jgi:S1-C subfamily serine protease
LDRISLIGAPEALDELLRLEGYEVVSEAPDVILMGGEHAFSRLASFKSHLPAPRVILLGSDIARALNEGADDAVHEDAGSEEILARVRSQFRAHRAEAELRNQALIAEEGFHVSQTAFHALAVTEKMTSDAFSLQKLLKYTAYTVIGAVVALFIILAIISRREQKQSQQAYHTITEMGKRLDSANKSAHVYYPADPVAEHKQRLADQSESLRQQITDAPPSEVAALRKQLEETQKHLSHIDDEARMARGIIAKYSSSVCLLHVVVGFHDHFTGRHLRVDVEKTTAAQKTDPKAEPALTLDGSGPEVRLDFFGTGFLAAADGRIITNHHVAEPWWENDELSSSEKENLEPVALEMSAYFPGDPKTYRVKPLKISTQVDLALLKVDSLIGEPDLSTLRNRPVPELDGSANAAEGGEGVVLMGYPTGLDAILARTSDANAEAILKQGSSRDVMTELAKRRMIRPLVTQGHIGDVLKDKIVYDAQTTSGGSGGPLFNSQGKVIGVNFAILQGFGGSNFGIPIRYAAPLLK